MHDVQPRAPVCAVTKSITMPHAGRCRCFHIGSAPGHKEAHADAAKSTAASDPMRLHNDRCDQLVMAVCLSGCLKSYQATCFCDGEIQYTICSSITERKAFTSKLDLSLWDAALDSTSAEHLKCPTSPWPSSSSFKSRWTSWPSSR